MQLNQEIQQEENDKAELQDNVKAEKKILKQKEDEMNKLV